jgi:hypothetical protein
MQHITFLDETATGTVLQSWEVPVETDSITLEALIMLRVKEEIKRLETAQADQYFAFWREQSVEDQKIHLRNSPKNKPEPADPEASGYRALEAFQRNAFFVLVDNKQVDRLDEILPITPQSTVSFVRLTPLVGG